ncbi:cucumber peeling cupredoxin-like [Hibiscus syriacus]|uniref:Cucumber peeling cupredoxin-like n=1 Tax=Hibiscus syriacus TaxID=106335 RepID=A0A6A2Y2I2_HIBSY|nr:cucumber peeling cupredoxin-like [Hibiscus syriacus]
MEDIGLFEQGLKWLESQKHVYSKAKTAAAWCRDKVGLLMERHWPMVCSGCVGLCKFSRLVLIYWKNCLVRGFHSCIQLGPASLLVIMWSCFLSVTSMSCLLYVLLSMGAAGAAVQYLGYTPGLFIVGLFGILVLWMYANFWITGTLFIVGGASCKSSSKSATTSVINQKEFTAKRVVKEETSSTDEMKRILNSMNHYEALGFPRHIKVDAGILKKEYRKKAMLVHPDKNMGSPLASESFKKLQCAYEVLSDSMKKRDYDEQLRKEESKARSVCQKSHSSSHQQSTSDHRSEESRRIQCTKCGNSHIWVCTNRNKAKARWCQDCCQYHQAKDGDGWVEYKGSLVFDRPQKVEIPRAFVCAESKIFDVSEWAICQGMACRPNTHRPSFHVNMVGLEKTQRSKSSRYPWGLDAEMIDEDEEEFELWLQQALASGLFCETSKRRKSWSPFKLPQNKSKKQWRRTST